MLEPNPLSKSTNPLSKSLIMDDHSASILLELKNAGETAETELCIDDASSLPNQDGNCQLTHCLLCSRGVPSVLIRSPTWASIMRVVFYCLQQDSPNKQYFNLKTDVYGFMTTHWTQLCLDKKRSDNWHKQIQDMLSHSKNLFESGMEKYKQNGFWRMKQKTDPWTIRKDKGAKSNKSSKRPADSEDHQSPKRRKIECQEDPADSNDEIDTQPCIEQQRSLEEQVRTLKEALLSMTHSMNAMKEELQKRDNEIAEKNYSYFQLMEQMKLLQHNSYYNSQKIPDLRNVRLSPTKPAHLGLLQAYAAPVFGAYVPMTSSGHRVMSDDDEELRSGEVPQLIKLSPLSMAHL